MAARLLSLKLDLWPTCAFGRPVLCDHSRQCRAFKPLNLLDFDLANLQRCPLDSVDTFDRQQTLQCGQTKRYFLALVSFAVSEAESGKSGIPSIFYLAKLELSGDETISQISLLLMINFTATCPALGDGRQSEAATRGQKFAKLTVRLTVLCGESVAGEN